MGSMPIIEDVVTTGACRSAFHVLKTHNAPVIYIKMWEELGAVLEREKTLSLKQKEERRRKLIIWYEKFRKKLGKSFIEKIRSVCS